MSARDKLALLPPDARRSALECLDEISRPLEVREIDTALAVGGIPRSQRRPMIRALMAQFEIIAIEPVA